MTYKLRFHALALKEWQQLDDSVRAPLKKKLAERLLNPCQAASALRGMPNCYKIKLHSLGYRLIYGVDALEVFVSVIATGKREKNKVYSTAQARL